MAMATPTIASEPIQIPIAGGLHLDADLTLVPDANGLVLFAHGSGSSRHSPRNRYVASKLNSMHMATLLADLLTPGEESLDERSGAFRFDIGLLTRRMIQMIGWARTQEPMHRLRIGLFGASTGAAAALDAAAALPHEVAAVVSRGGRPDLATRLREVRAPTLLIVGGNDPAVLQMNRAALRELQCAKQLEVIPKATHLFEEPGALEAVARAAGHWFEKYLHQE